MPHTDWAAALVFAWLCMMLALLYVVWREYRAKQRLQRWLAALYQAAQGASKAEPQGQAAPLSQLNLAPPEHLPARSRELAQRYYKLIRTINAQTQSANHRLQDFLAALQATPDGLVLLDTHYRIEWLNQTAALQLGLDVQRDVGQHIQHLVREPEFAQILQRPQRLEQGASPAPQSISNPPSNDVQFVRRLPNAPALQLDIHLHAYGQGRYLLLSRDITLLARTEAMRRDFVANVSHEIRSPLTVLSGLLESMQQLPLSPSEHSESLALMDTQSKRMQSLVSDLLSLSKLEASPAVHARVSVRMLWQQIEHELKTLSAGQHQLQLLSSTLDEQDDFLQGAATELQSAFSNLVSNAVRYTPAGGQITIGWQHLHSGEAEFFVQDTGLGIAPEHLPRLTERFYRVDSSRSSETGGTGLGLAIVKHIAQRHAAQLLIESTLGKGSCFRLRFPQSVVSQ